MFKTVEKIVRPIYGFIGKAVENTYLIIAIIKLGIAQQSQTVTALCAGTGCEVVRAKPASAGLRKPTKSAA